MENASKALVIAGAILISIVLITLGVVILGQGQNVVNSSNMDAQVVQSWNGKFLQYVGESVSGTNVNALIDAVCSSNAISNRDKEYYKLIKIAAADDSVTNGKITSITNSKASDNKTEYTIAVGGRAIPGVNYKVYAAYDKSTGYIVQLTIKSL